MTVKRASVRIPAVDSRMERDADGDKVGYVAFHTFSEGAHGELRSAIEGLYRRGAQGLVLDLRDNGGGLLDEAILCASIFYDNGNVVSTRSRTQGDKDYPAVGNDAIDPHPTVILTTRNTASAAEILSAALQQNHLAKDHPDYAAALRTERHPDADFARPAGDFIRHGPVEAHTGNRQRKDRKRGAQAGKRDLLVDCLVDPRALALYLGEGQARVCTVHQFAHGVDVVERVPRGPQLVRHLLY